jgi:hypothetical protein
VLHDVRVERDRQDAKWGQQNHLDGTSRERDLDARNARLRCDTKASLGTVKWLDILLEEVMEAAAEEDPAKLREELVQVAAVAVSWVEAIDRRVA